MISLRQLGKNKNPQPVLLLAFAPQSDTAKPLRSLLAGFLRARGYVQDVCLRTSGIHLHFAFKARRAEDLSGAMIRDTQRKASSWLAAFF